MPVTRGFVGKRRGQERRLPPGQYDTGASWPVLTAEATPRIEPERWSRRGPLQRGSEAALRLARREL